MGPTVRTILVEIAEAIRRINDTRDTEQAYRTLRSIADIIERRLKDHDLDSSWLL